MAQSSPAGIASYLDLVVLTVAIPVFLLGGFPMAGLIVAGGVWLAQRAAQRIALSRARRSLGEANRKRALGILAATMLGRVWSVALAVLLVGLADREAGLAAAVLAAALVTAYVIGEGINKVFGPEDAGEIRA